MEPEYIGRYRVVGKLGRGGMGSVVRAVDEVRQRDVAIKLPIERDPEVIKRLQQECDVLAQLQHHNIVQIFGSGSDTDLPFYIVMEFVDGPTVEELLQRQGALAARQAFQIGLGVAEALAHAHRPPLRVIHRDIKPGNILIRQSDQMVKVTDFGIAAVLSQRSGNTVVGTMSYMSPEQAMGKGADERSDLYSLGALLYEMLTGQRPPQIAATPAVAPSKMAGAKIPPELGERVDRLVLMLLERDPNKRFPRSAAETVEEIRAILEGRPARAQSGSAGSWAYDSTIRASRPPQATSYPTPPPPSSRPPTTYPTYRGAPQYSAPPGRPLSPQPVPYAQPIIQPQPVQIVPVQPLIVQPAYQVVPVVAASAVPSRPTSGKAVASLVLGILLMVSSLGIPFYLASAYSTTCTFLVGCNTTYVGLSVVPLIVWLGFAFLPVLLGHLALGDIGRSAGRLGGKGMAIAGLVMGYIGLAGLVLLVIAAH